MHGRGECLKVSGEGGMLTGTTTGSVTHPDMSRKAVRSTVTEGDFPSATGKTMDMNTSLRSPWDGK